MKNNVIKNFIMLYGLTFAKLIFPLLTLPYLTRVLTVDTYGGVAYVKALMGYFQVVVDFGFMLSGTKEIVMNREDKKKLGEITGDIIFSRIILAIFCFCVLLILTSSLSILRGFILYAVLSYTTVFLSIFLFDYLFRGLERMEIITVRFIVMKGLATFLIFFMVKSDADMLWIPVLDLLGSLSAIIFVFKSIKKLDIKIRVTGWKSSLNKIKESFIFFASNMATTIFGALNTIIIGMVLSKEDVAYWSVCMQIIGAVQSLYTPITDGIYPEMIKSHNMKLIRKVAFIFSPIIFIGTIFSFFLAPAILQIIAGQDYRAAADLFRCLVPVLFFSFYAILFGWPALGAVNREKEVTLSTIISAVFQLSGLLLMLLINQFNLIKVAILRNLTEVILMTIRVNFFVRYKK